MQAEQSYAMYNQHLATLILGKSKENQHEELSQLSSHNPEIVPGEVQSAYWPSVAGSSDATSSSSFATTLQEPYDAQSTKLSDDTSWFSFGETTQMSLERPDSHFEESFEIDTTANTASQFQQGQQDQQDQQILSSSHPHEHSGPLMSGYSFEDIPKPARYYTATLTEEDMRALTCGEKNHNLKEWSGKDLITHHESQRDLVPRVMPKVEKTMALAGIEHDKQHSQRAVTKVIDKVRQVFGLPRIKITADNGKEEQPSFKQLPQTSQSAYDLRSIDVSVPQPSSSPMTSPPPSRFSVDNVPIEHRSSHTRALSSGDYFSQRPSRRTSAYPNRSRISPLASPSPSSENSVRVRSPLAQEVGFCHNPEVTFDSFLVPHKSGKGETHHGAVNAKKPKTPKGSPVVSPQVTPLTKRLSRLPSLPLLRRSTEG